MTSLTTSLPGALGRLAAAATNPIVGACEERFDLASFRTFAERHGASAFLHAPGDRNAVAVVAGSSR